MDIIHSVHNRLNIFYKKYYLTQFWIGCLFSSVTLSLSWYIFSITEYFIYLPKLIKTSILFLFILASFALIFFKVLTPLLLYFKLKKGLHPEDIAKIIGNHFKGDVDDVLLNSIQLSKNSSPIALAAIEQKINKIQHFNFLKAIDRSLLYQWLKIASIPLVLFIITLIFQPSFIVEGSSRVVQFNHDFYPPNPYNFKFINSNFSFLKNESITLEVEYTDKRIPDELYLIIQNQSFRFLRKGNLFQIVVPPLTQSTQFVLKMGDYYSDSYTFTLIEKPTIKSFTVNVTPPNYTSMKPYIINNQQSLLIHQGSKISIDFVLENSTKLNVNHQTYNVLNNKFTYSTQVINSFELKIKPFKGNTILSDDLTLNITMINDNFPEVVVKDFPDSTLFNQMFFEVNIKDDYGIVKTEMFVESIDSIFITKIALPSNFLTHQFNYFIDFNKYKDLGKRLKIYFKSWDNDLLGSKSAISSPYFYNFPSDYQIDSILSSSKDELKSLMNSTLNSLIKQQKEIQSIQDELFQKSTFDWKDKKRLQDLFSNQKNLEKQLNNIKNLQDLQKSKEDNLKPLDLDLLDKQKQIDELFNKLLDPETKKLFDELNKLMNQFKDKQQVQDVLQKINNENIKTEQSIDKTLEMFKRFEVDQLLEDAINDLDKLSLNQEDLRKNLDNISKEDALNKQNDLNESFNELQKKLQDLESKNKLLERPKSYEIPFDKVNDIKSKLNDSKQSLTNDDKRNAKKNQKSVEDKLKELSNQLQSMQSTQNQKQDSEDARVLRQILENLLYLSNKQEELLNKTKYINPLDPKFTTLAQEQKKLMSDAKIINDSLVALSKRQIQIQDLVDKELFNLMHNLKLSQDLMFSRQPYNAVVKQQFSMTSANILALLLDESLQKMQEQIKNSQPGSGSCSKPGGNNPKPSDSMSELKDMLSKQIDQMKKQLEKGNSPGNMGDKGDKGAAKDFAQLAAQQAALKEKLKQLEKQLQNQGNGSSGDLPQLLNDIENIEKELYNKNLSLELLNRQKKIMTKLLESEKGILEQELDEQRKGETVKNFQNRNFIPSLQYNKTDLNNMEYFNKTNPTFNLYYKSKISEYFNNFEQP